MLKWLALLAFWAGTAQAQSAQETAAAELSALWEGTPPQETTGWTLYPPLGSDTLFTISQCRVIFTTGSVWPTPAAPNLHTFLDLRRVTLAQGLSQSQLDALHNGNEPSILPMISAVLPDQIVIAKDNGIEPRERRVDTYPILPLWAYEDPDRFAQWFAALADYKAEYCATFG